MARGRYSVALLVPAPAAAEIDGLRRALGHRARERVAPHVTLVPPVNLTTVQLGEALALLRAAAASTRPFVVRLGPPATFRPATPVVYLPVGCPEGSPDDVTPVHALRRKVFVPPLARRLHWPFVPHVTVSEGIDPDRINAALRALRDFELECRFDAVHLLAEQRTDGPPRWLPIADLVFEPPVVVGRGGVELTLRFSALLAPDVAELAVAPDAGAVARWQAAVSMGEPSLVVSAWRDEHPVGVALGTIRSVRPHWVAVAEDHRGGGVARQLRLAFESRVYARSRAVSA